MPTVLFVESGLTGGGSFESLFQHIRAMDRKEYRPAVFFLNRTKYAEEAKSLHVPLRIGRDFLYDRDRRDRHPRVLSFLERALVASEIAFPLFSIPLELLAHASAMRDLAAFGREVGADIVHTNNQVNRDFYAIACATRLRLPCVCHLRSFFTLGFNRFKAAFVNRHSACFIAYSKTIAQTWIGRGLDPAKTAVVPNAIGDLEVSPANLSLQYAIPPDRKVVGIIGKLIPERGHEFLLRAVAQAVSGGLNAHLLSVGPGDPTRVRNLERLARELGVPDRATFAQPHPYAAEVIAALDVLVLPYSIEPFGRVLLEAWILGTPVVASRIGGIETMFRHRRDGLLADYGDVEGLARALKEILGDAALRAEVIRNGRDRCRSDYSIAAHVARVQEIYARVLYGGTRTAF